MSKELLKSLIDYIPQQDVDTLYRVIVKFIPEDIAEADEVEAIARAMADSSPTIPHSAIDWD